MEILLCEDIPGLGDIGERVKVKPGHARNFLIPRGLGIECGSKNASKLKHQSFLIDRKKNQLKEEALKVSENIKNITLEMGLRVASGGKVFGSIRQKDISDALEKQDLKIDRRRILLDEPIKKIGTREIKIKLHPEVIVPMKISILKLEATEEEEKQETASARVNVEKTSLENQEEETIETASE